MSPDNIRQIYDELEPIMIQLFRNKLGAESFRSDALGTAEQKEVLAEFYNACKTEAGKAVLIKYRIDIEDREALETIKASGEKAKREQRKNDLATDSTPKKTREMIQEISKDGIVAAALERQLFIYKKHKEFNQTGIGPDERDVLRNELRDALHEIRHQKEGGSENIYFTEPEFQNETMLSKYIQDIGSGKNSLFQKICSQNDFNPNSPYVYLCLQACVRVPDTPYTHSIPMVLIINREKQNKIERLIIGNSDNSLPGRKTTEFFLEMARNLELPVNDLSYNIQSRNPGGTDENCVIYSCDFLLATALFISQGPTAKTILMNKPSDTVDKALQADIFQFMPKVFRDPLSTAGSYREYGDLLDYFKQRRNGLSDVPIIEPYTDRRRMPTQENILTSTMLLNAILRERLSKRPGN